MCEKQKNITEFYETTVKEIMLTLKSDIPHIADDVDIINALSILQKKDHVWVMNSKEPNQLVGVITESDTIVFFSPPLTSSQIFDSPDPRSLQFGETLTTQEIMSKNPVTAAPDEKIRDVIVKMKEQKIKHLPIVDEFGQLIGELSLHRILEEYLKYHSDTKNIT